MNGVMLMKRMAFLFLAVSLFGISVVSSDWLEGGYVGSPDYGEIRQYFTDPIFFMKVPASQPSRFYSGTPFTRTPVFLGKYTPRTGPLAFQMPPNASFYPSSPWQSEFRNRSLAAMEWSSFRKNWTGTMDYAKTKSSMKVFKDGTWSSI